MKYRNSTCNAPLLHRASLDRSRHVSIIQTRFYGPCQMTEFNRFQGLQSRFKPLSIYTVVLLYSKSRWITAVQQDKLETNRQYKRESVENQHKERGYYGR